MRNKIFDICLKLLSNGYSVVPSGSGTKGKYPLVKWREFQKRLPTEDELKCWLINLRPRLWGVVTGELSGIVVIDADDTKSRSIFKQAGFTPHILTPRCANFWFRHPGHFVKTEAGILPNLDIRGDKGFVNTIGVRRDGGIYRIAKWPVPKNIYQWESLPVSVVEAINKREKLEPQPTFDRVDEHSTSQIADEHSHLANILLHRATTIAVDGTRNQIGLWLGCQLRDNGFAVSEAETVILKYASVVRGLDPSDPYTADEAMNSLKQTYSRRPREPWNMNIRNRSFQHDKV